MSDENQIDDTPETDGEPAPVKRGRGRPKGSLDVKTRQKIALKQVDVEKTRTSLTKRGGDKLVVEFEDQVAKLVLEQAMTTNEAWKATSLDFLKTVFYLPVRTPRELRESNAAALDKSITRVSDKEWNATPLSLDDYIWAMNNPEATNIPDYPKLFIVNALRGTQTERSEAFKRYHLLLAKEQEKLNEKKIRADANARIEDLRRRVELFRAGLPAR